MCHGRRGRVAEHAPSGTRSPPGSSAASAAAASARCSSIRACAGCGNRHADLLFNIVSSRTHQNSTIITTNRPFAEWTEAFPNASCVVALVDRLVHNAEIIAIDGDSYRRKEAEERQKQRSAERRQRRAAKAHRRSGKSGPQDTGGT